MAMAAREHNGVAAKVWAKLFGMARAKTDFGDRRVRKLIRAGDLEAARKLVAQFPSDALATGLLQGDLLRAERRLDDLVAHLGGLVEQHGLKPDLCVQYDEALQQTGRFDAAEALFSRVLEEKPDAVDCLADMAQTADREESFGLGVSRWMTLSELKPRRADFHKKYIRSLTNVLETEKAARHFEAFADTFRTADFHLIRVEILEAQERYSESLSALDEIAAEWGESAEVAFKRGACLRGAGRLDEAEDLFQTLHKRQPGNFSLAAELAKTAMASRNFVLATERWRSICLAHPDKTGMHSGYIDALLSLPDIEAATAHYEAVCVTLDKEPFRYNQWIKILHAANDLEGVEETIEAYLDRLRPGQAPVRLRAALMHKKAQFLLRRYVNTGDESAFEKMRAILEDLIAKHPWDVLSRIQQCKVLIALEMPEEAMRAIDDLPQSFEPRIVELNMWRASRGGDEGSAKALWDRRKTVHFIPHLKPCPPGSLRRRDDNRIATDGDEIRVFTAIRNEKWRLPWFLDYYRSLGVNRFFFVDNDSNDGSGEYLLEQPDVHVFWTEESYAVAYSGMRWINQLAREYGRSGWVSYVDVDEALVFPGVETAGLRRLTEYMDAKDHEALPAFMLDMFAEDAPSHDGEEAIDFVESYPLFDSRIDRYSSVHCPYVFARGGVRQAFGWGELLTKTPLIRGGRGISFLMSSHIVSPARVSDVSATLLHFKLTGDFRETFRADLSDNARMPSCRRRYQNYERYLQSQGGDVQFSNAFTKTYAGSGQLLELGLIEAPDDYLSTIHGGEGVRS